MASYTGNLTVPFKATDLSTMLSFRSRFRLRCRDPRDQLRVPNTQEDRHETVSSDVQISFSPCPDAHPAIGCDCLQRSIGYGSQQSFGPADRERGPYRRSRPA